MHKLHQVRTFCTCVNGVAPRSHAHVVAGAPVGCCLCGWWMQLRQCERWLTAACCCRASCWCALRLACIRLGIGDPFARGETALPHCELLQVQYLRAHHCRAALSACTMLVDHSSWDIHLPPSRCFRASLTPDFQPHSSWLFSAEFHSESTFSDLARE